MVMFCCAYRLYRWFSVGPASYVELLSCLEIMRDARPSRTPIRSTANLAPVSARRAKRK
jgi:hypothetical protein